MSWLYTIIFSGLVFSHGVAPAAAPPSNINEAVPASMAARDETDRFEQNYPLSANGRVSVSNINGSITVEAWDKNEIRLEAVKTADSKESLDLVQIKVDAKADSFSVKADYGDWKLNGGTWNRDRRVEVQFKLMVPRGAVLNEIETVNGSVTVSNFTNSTRISAVNGNVNATNLRGTANLSTVNGEVAADFTELDGASRISLSTVNGRVNLVIPSDSSATVKADSVNGNISNDFGLPVRKGKYVGRDLYGKIGGGMTNIRLESVNGDLKIGRSSDGRTPGPVVNLLPQKDKDDEDWNDNDNDDQDEDQNNDDNSKASVKARKDVEREVARATRNSSKIAAKAAAKAQVEISKIQPVMAEISAQAIEQAAQVVRSTAVRDALRSSEAAVTAGIRSSTDALRAMADARYIVPAPRVERKSNSFDVKGTPTITIDAPGCAVRITGTDSSTVKYSVTDVSTQRNAPSVKVVETNTKDSVELRVEGAEDNDRWRTRIEISVPKKSNLKVMTDGEIRVDGISGTLDLTGVDESINVRDVDGKLTARTQNGRIRLIGFKGELDASSESGMLSLDGDFDALSAASEYGDIVITLPTNIAADIDADAKSVDFDGFPAMKQSATAQKKHFKLDKGGRQFIASTSASVVFRSNESLAKAF